MYMLGTELGVMDMTEAEYMHLQHLIQGHMEAQAQSQPDTGLDNDPTVSKQAIDLSSSEMRSYGENTPVSYGDVPEFVLAKVRGEDSLTSSSSRVTIEKKSSRSARVCLEKRFNAIAVELPGPQDLQSSVLNNCLTIIQQTTEAREEVMHAQTQKYIKTDRANSFEDSSPYQGDVLNSGTNMRGQVIGHIPYIIEPGEHQGFIIPKGLIIPKGFSFNLDPERTTTKDCHTSSSSPTEEQQLMDIQSKGGMATPGASKKYSSQRTRTAQDAVAGPRTRKKDRSFAPPQQRRERHNTKERERRKRIRLYCDELNMLVPFCDSDTDKVTTLKWATAYLRYITKAHGDTFKVEFQKSLTSEKDQSTLL